MKLDFTPIGSRKVLMDSAGLYLELQDTEERLSGALAHEKEVRRFGCQAGRHAHWQRDLRIARREVQWAGEFYALALRTYRLAMLAELAPDLAVASQTHARAVARHVWACPASGFADTGAGSAPCSRRGAAGAYPASQRLAKSD
jgi:hypothetical protein